MLFVYFFGIGKFCHRTSLRRRQLRRQLPTAVTNAKDCIIDKFLSKLRPYGRKREAFLSRNCHFSCSNDAPRCLQIDATGAQKCIQNPFKHLKWNFL